MGGGVAVRVEEAEGFAFLVGKGLAIEVKILGDWEMVLGFDAEEIFVFDDLELELVRMGIKAGIDKNSGSQRRVGGLSYWGRIFWTPAR